MVPHTQTWHSYLNKMLSSRAIITFKCKEIANDLKTYWECWADFQSQWKCPIVRAMLFIMDIDDILMIVCDIWYPVGSLKTSLHGCSYFTLDEKKL